MHMIEIGRSGCAPAQRRRKAAGGALLILMAGLTGCAPKLAPKASPPLVTVAQPITRRIIDWDDYVGQFVAPENVEVRPRVAGYIQSIAFKDGAGVRKGDLLFVIDPRPYKAVLDQAKAQQQHAQASVQDAEIEERRAEGLVEAKALSDQDLQTRKSTLAQARADLAAARAAVDAAQLNIGFTRVTAPISGHISDRRVSPGNLVTQDQTILTSIVSIDPMWFGFEAPEAAFLKYERANLSTTAAAVQIRLQDEAAYRWSGRIDFVDNQINQGSGVIRGRAIVSNPKHLLTPGMFGHMRLEGSRPYDALLVPDTAIVTDQDRQLLYVVGADDVVRSTAITPGPLYEGLRVVLSGLKPTDRVVVDGLQRVKLQSKVNAVAGRIAPTPAAPGQVYVTPAGAASDATQLVVK